MDVFTTAWLPMPQQQQFPPQNGHEGAGHGGSGGYGGGSGEGGEGGSTSTTPEDRSAFPGPHQDHDTGTPWGGPSDPGGEGPAPTQPSQPSADDPRGVKSRPSPTDVSIENDFAQRHGIDRGQLRGYAIDKHGRIGVRVGLEAYDAITEARIEAMDEDERKTAKMMHGLDKLSRKFGVTGVIIGAIRDMIGTPIDAVTGLPSEMGAPEMEGGEGPHEEATPPVERVRQAPTPPAQQAPGGAAPVWNDKTNTWNEGYRRRLREVMERLLGDMPDGGYEVPDWNVLLSMDGPKPAVAAQGLPVPPVGEEVFAGEIERRLDEWREREEQG